MSQKPILNNNQSIKTIFYAIASFALPVLLLGVALWYLYNSQIEDDAYKFFTQRYSDFNGTFFVGVNHDIKDLTIIRPMIFSPISYVRTEGIRSLLAYHMDLFFVISLLLNVTAKRVFTTYMFIRIGLASLSANHLIRKHVGVKGVMSLVLSTAYALSGPVLAGSANTMVLDFAIVAPLILACLDSMTRKRTTLTRVLFVVSVALSAFCGINGYLSGLILVISGSFIIIFASAASGKRLGAFAQVAIAYLAGSLCGAVAIFPSASMAGNVINMSDVMETNIVRYKLFDVIGTLFDGRILSTASVNGIPQIAVSITVLFLFALFLINERTPFALKLTAVISLLVIYASISWSVLDNVLSVFGPSEVGIYSRLIVFAVLMVFYAAISLRNLSTLTSSDIHMACAIVLGVLIVHKAVCDVVGPSVFSMLISFASVITITCVCKFLSVNNNHPLESVFAAVIIAGMFINLVFVLGPSEFFSDFMENKVGVESGNKEIFTTEGKSLSIFDSDSLNEYVLIKSDISELIVDKSTPEIINVVSDSANAGEIFESTNTRTAFAHGFKDLGEGIFSPQIEGNDSLITLRGEDFDLTQRYFAYSGFTNTQALCEIYGESAEESSYKTKFFTEIAPHASNFNLRLSMMAGNSDNEYSIWMLNETNFNCFDSLVKNFSDSTIVLDNTYMNLPGSKTIITSIDYDDKYEVKSDKGVSQKTINIASKLGIIVENPQSGTELTIKVPFYDMICGLILSIISILAVAGFVVSKKLSDKNSSGGHVDVGQEDN